MSTLRVMILLLVAGLLGGLGGVDAYADRPDRAPDPETLAKQCVERMARKTDVCVHVISTTTKHAVARIKHLVAQGKRELARKAAQQAIEQVNRQAKHGIALVNADAGRCIKILLRLDERELAMRVRNAARGDVEEISRARRRAVNAIHGALTG